ncbi:hypothetical protein T439DRAFT_329287 [Meredithblackwellia eburnea MCA 4105]
MACFILLVSLLLIFILSSSLLSSFLEEMRKRRKTLVQGAYSKSQETQMVTMFNQNIEETQKL